MRYIAFILICNCNLALACGNYGDFGFGGYGSDFNLGDSARIEGKRISINRDFIPELIENPTGDELAKNRQELLYLISVGDKDALFAGTKVLIHLLQNPEYEIVCDSKYELWGKEEIAFAVSRNFNFHENLCRFRKDEWNLVVDFFEEHPALWGMIYDPPWVHREDYICDSHK